MKTLILYSSIVHPIQEEELFLCTLLNASDMWPLKESKSMPIEYIEMSAHIFHAFIPNPQKPSSLSTKKVWQCGSSDPALKKNVKYIENFTSSHSRNLCSRIASGLSSTCTSSISFFKTPWTSSWPSSMSEGATFVVNSFVWESAGQCFFCCRFGCGCNAADAASKLCLRHSHCKSQHASAPLACFLNWPLYPFCAIPKIQL